MMNNFLPNNEYVNILNKTITLYQSFIVSGVKFVFSVKYFISALDKTFVFLRFFLKRPLGAMFLWKLETELSKVKVECTSSQIVVKYIVELPGGSSTMFQNRNKYCKKL